MNILKHKDYEGTAELDMERFACRGKILFIDDLVTYEADSPSNLQKEFEAAVDDYIETCALLNREPKKPLKGQFNVRVPSALHKAAALRAIADDISLNDVVVRALDAYVNIKTDVNHNVKLTVEMPDQPVTMQVAGMMDAQWGTMLYASKH
ncbi:type II toxin-antitoxin system HicB family antitoxin [Ferribacterium limneticum]|uniref:type II toxin-antitoxin system HicB family antitoxin n=1 Tax=Ferribacterium limneticum TaxID=76259 RepID=UPI001CF9B7BC|nr:type II toxin-antitoxin system HicB family antitoxin [Ferribacterium limneticum]UCV28295.1 type II toxin-antitoxin system HicB family antitoxin [Ferribacterium limneticum]UCV32212.1 type II toxin-antitoxin system HicB family antitoxin [Ferribacterium limneticum]